MLHISLFITCNSPSYIWNLYNIFARWSISNNTYHFICNCQNKWQL